MTSPDRSLSELWELAYWDLAPRLYRIPGVMEARWLPAIRFREHCITCFNCEIFCPERIVDVHPSVKNRPLAW